MSKLIVCTGTLSSGGAERVLSILSKSFADAFDEVEYVMWLDAKSGDVFYKIDSRVKIIRLCKACGSTNILKRSWWFRKHIIAQKPDIVLSFMVMINFSVIASLIGTGVKIIAAERNDPKFFHHGKILRYMINKSYMLNNVKGILMQTEKNRSYFTSNKLYNKTSVICNPISMPKEIVGSALKVGKKDIIVSVGRLTKQKQQNVMINAFAKFHTKYPNYKLIIYGEGDLRTELEKQIETMNLKDSVLLPGRTDDVFNKMQSARMFVLTSRYEGMSNSLLEAMCLGLPCISTEVSGATEVINSGYNGYLVNIDDDSGVASIMEEIACNAVLAKNIGQNATRIYRNMSVNVIAKQWINYLKSQ